MIVISGALVIVALGLLIAGLVVSSGLVLVYASIGVSVLSAVFLFLGVRQRRGDDDGARVAATPGLAAAGAAPAVAAAPAAPAAAPASSDEGVRTVPPRQPAAPVLVGADPVAAEPAPVSASQPGEAAAGEVFVVPGRPRYHAAGCRYLSGRETETRSVAEAQAEGFAACGVCRPDEASSVASPAAEPAAPAPVPAAPRRRAPQTRTAQVDSAEAVAARQATPDDDEPQTAPARAVDAAAPAPARSRGETVVVIPERGRYHRPECRYVRGVEGAREMTKTGARRQGYSACGVCKP